MGPLADCLQIWPIFVLNLRTFVNMAHSWLWADSLLSACEWAENGTLQFA